MWTKLKDFEQKTLNLKIGSDNFPFKLVNLTLPEKRFGHGDPGAVPGICSGYLIPPEVFTSHRLFLMHGLGQTTLQSSAPLSAMGLGSARKLSCWCSCTSCAVTALEDAHVYKKIMHMAESSKTMT